MKNKIRISLVIYLFSNSALLAQNNDKMNKSQLREYIYILTTEIDYFKNENIKLQDSISILSINSLLLEQNNKTNQVEISRINELIVKNEIERKKIISANIIAISKLNETILTLKDSISDIQSSNQNKISKLNKIILTLKDSVSSVRSSNQNEIEISKLNETILTLRDSISSVRSSSNVFSTSTTYNRSDFLNSYYFDQIPLPNNSFSLKLSKLVYGDKINDNDNGYYDNNQGVVKRLPEILDPNAFTYWGLSPNAKIREGSNWTNYLIPKNSDYLNSKLPKIEILKNKLFTIKYNNGIEESFLFNVKQIIPEDNNNQRSVLQIELANEEVKADGSNNTAKDIIWRFFAIENECYLALTLEQLERLNLKLYHTRWDDGYNYEYITTGEEICLSRNKDMFMDGSNYIDPREIIYLFKLK
jgi:hypothetical protein